LAIGAPIFFGAASASAAGPTVVPLDGVAGSAGVSARAMAADGTVVGGNGMGGQATVWTKGAGGAYAAQLLPLSAGLDDGFANAVNVGGAIAGYQVDAAGNPTASVWQRGGASGYAVSALPTPAGAVGASAYAINAGGEVAGFAQMASGDTFGVVWRPATGGGYSAVSLATPAGVGGEVAATGINDHGLIVGYGHVPGATYVPVVWGNAAAAGQGVVVVQGAVATAVNNNGVGAGVDISGSNPQPLVVVPYEGDYYGGTLPVAGFDGRGASNHVNDADVIVGYAVDGSDSILGHAAALWNPTDTYWDYLNLNEWLRGQTLPGGGEWTLRDANFITAENLVVGDGFYDPDGAGPLAGYDRAFVLDVSSAVPEPVGAAAIAGVGAALITRRRYASLRASRGSRREPRVQGR
jgi:hypothetical protein